MLLSYSSNVCVVVFYMVHGRIRGVQICNTAVNCTERRIIMLSGGNAFCVVLKT